MRLIRHLAGLVAVGFITSGLSFAGTEASDIRNPAALKLAEKHHCFTCHAIDRKVVGPAWEDVAARYRGDEGAENRLVNKVSSGGNGVWEKEVAMPAFGPYVKETDIRTLVQFVLSLK